MDIQKEREAFDEEFGVAEFNIFASNDENLKQSMVLKCNWLGWKACAEHKQTEINELKAKLEAAQVKDGFVLMPMVPSQAMVDAVRKCYEGESYLPYSLYSEFVNQAIIEAAQGEGHE